VQIFTLKQERTNGRRAWDGAAHLVPQPFRHESGYVCGKRVAKGLHRWPEPIELDAGAVKLCGNCSKRAPALFRLLGSDAVRGVGA
jgi:hypothetical protein